MREQDLLAFHAGTFACVYITCTCDVPMGSINVISVLPSVPPSTLGDSFKISTMKLHRQCEAWVSSKQRTRLSNIDIGGSCQMLPRSLNNDVAL